MLQRMDRWMIPILGSLVAQETISRVLAAKSMTVARLASFVAAGIYDFMGSIPVLLGLGRLGACLAALERRLTEPRA